MATKEPNRKLKNARESAGYSQQEVADLVGVRKNTYQRWETGETFPQPPFRRLLSEKLNASLQELGLVPGKNDPPSATIELKDASEYREEQNEYLQSNLGSRLLGIVDAGTYDDQRNNFAQIMERFDAMNTENQDYEITRRQAVISLATFPFAPPINLEKRERVASSGYELFVKECGASLTACEELARSSDARDLWLAFRCVSRYLVELEVICHSPSRYRTQALELAAHCAVLKTKLGWGRAGSAATILFAQDAIDFARESGNIRWLLSAYSKKAWAYFYDDQRKLALETALVARDLLKEQKNPLPVCIRGGTWSTLSLIQAKNKLSSDTARQKAIEQGPDNEIQYLLDFTPKQMQIEQGKILYYAGATGDALETYAQVVDPDTLQPTKLFKETLTETRRIETILDMSRASLKGVVRNKENAIHYWEEAIEGAKRLKSETLYSEALKIYDQMDLIFPDEQEVHNLLDHFRRGKDWR